MSSYSTAKTWQFCVSAKYPVSTFIDCELNIYHTCVCSDNFLDISSQIVLALFSGNLGIYCTT